ncbi:hypothetical protein ACMFMF_007110 [Clarireedia jacksonii]
MGKVQTDELPLQLWFSTDSQSVSLEMHPRIAVSFSKAPNPWLLNSSLLTRMKDTCQSHFLIDPKLSRYAPVQTPCPHPPPSFYSRLLSILRAVAISTPDRAARLTAQSYDLKHDLDSFPSP